MESLAVLGIVFVLTIVNLLITDDFFNREKTDERRDS